MNIDVFVQWCIIGIHYFKCNYKPQMSYPPRKILSLKEKCNRVSSKKSHIGDFPRDKNSFSSSSDSISLLANNNTALSRLYQERQGVLSEIKMLEQRLVFTSSMPLQQACNELKKKDIDILCRINDYLIAYPGGN